MTTPRKKAAPNAESPVKKTKPIGKNKWVPADEWEPWATIPPERHPFLPPECERECRNLRGWTPTNAREFFICEYCAIHSDSLCSNTGTGQMDYAGLLADIASILAQSDKYCELAKKHFSLGSRCMQSNYDVVFEKYYSLFHAARSKGKKKLGHTGTFGNLKRLDPAKVCAYCVLMEQDVECKKTAVFRTAQHFGCSERTVYNYLARAKE